MGVRFVPDAVYCYVRVMSNVHDNEQRRSLSKLETCHLLAFLFLPLLVELGQDN